MTNVNNNQVITIKMIEVNHVSSDRLKEFLSDRIANEFLNTRSRITAFYIFKIIGYNVNTFWGNVFAAM